MPEKKTDFFSWFVKVTIKYVTLTLGHHFILKLLYFFSPVVQLV